MNMVRRHMFSSWSFLYFPLALLIFYPYTVTSYFRYRSNQSEQWRSRKQGNLSCADIDWPPASLMSTRIHHVQFVLHCFQVTLAEHWRRLQLFHTWICMELDYAFHSISNDFIDCKYFWQTDKIQSSNRQKKKKNIKQNFSLMILQPLQLIIMTLNKIDLKVQRPLLGSVIKIWTILNMSFWG